MSKNLGKVLDVKSPDLPKSEESWLLSWIPNSEYVAQERGLKLPVGHSETIVISQTPEVWVKNNPHKTVIYLHRLR